MKNKFLSLLIASIISLTIINPITANATTLSTQNIATYSAEEIAVIESIRNNYHTILSEEEKNIIEDNRDYIKSQYSELGISPDTMDKLIDKQLSGISLDAYIPEMDQYSTTIINNSYIIKVYPDGSVNAKSKFDLNNPSDSGNIKGNGTITTFGIIQGHNIISSSAYHIKRKTWIQAFSGVSVATYTVTWTDYTSNVESTIDDVQHEGSFLCTFTGKEIKDNYWEDKKIIMSYDLGIAGIIGSFTDTTYIARQGSIYSK